MAAGCIPYMAPLPLAVALNFWPGLLSSAQCSYRSYSRANLTLTSGAGMQQ